MTPLTALEMAKQAHKASNNKHIKSSLEEVMELLDTIQTDVEDFSYKAWAGMYHHYLEDTLLLAGTEIEDDGQLEILGWLYNYKNDLSHVIKASNPSEYEDLITDGWDARL